MTASHTSPAKQAGDKIVASLRLPARSSPIPEAIPLPVMDLGTVLGSSSVGLSLVRVDGGGVVAARTAFSQLGWLAGTPVRFDVSYGLPVVGRSLDPSALRVPSKMSLCLPARLRSQCRIRTGEQVLLASLTDHDLLVVYPQHVVHEMVTGYHASLADGPPRTPAR